MIVDWLDIVMAAGSMMTSSAVVLFGAAVFAGVLLLQLVTLPVKLDATARAKRLNGATLTYVAAAFSTLPTSLYSLSRARLLGGSDA